MSIHLYLAPLPLHAGPSMVLATTPEAAISLLESGVVSRLSVAEDWVESCGIVTLTPISISISDLAYSDPDLDLVTPISDLVTPISRSRDPDLVELLL